TTSLIATRGCHNRCGFCYLATDGLRMPYRVPDPEQVVAEFLADGQPYAVFVDNNLGSRPAYRRALCRALAPLERIWSAAITLDVTDDPTLVREMALAGCTGVFIGFESLADENLAASRKKTPRAADYACRVGLLHEHGIQVNGSFVLGFDADGPDVFAHTAEWIEGIRRRRRGRATIAAMKRRLALAVVIALAVAPAAAQAPESRDMRLVGHHDLQARSAYQPLIVKQGDHFIAYVGHHGGNKPN